MTRNTPTGSARLGEDAVIPLSTLDPAGPLDDLGWLDEVIGDARVVAIGESSHYNGEFYQLRHRLLRYLVERHGFGAYAMESGFPEGWTTDRWVRGGQDDQLGHVLANGLTSLMGLWTQMRDQLEWLRRHNHDAEHPVGFYGIDLGGSNASPLPALDAATAYLERADPEFALDPGVRETAASFAASSAFAIPTAFSAYGNLAVERRDALTASLADLTARMTARRLDYVRRTSAEDFDRALRSLRLAVTVDSLFRGMARGDQQVAFLNRDAAMADTVEWILRREDRIVLAAHNGHVQRWPATLPGMPPVTPMGMHLADRLGEDYRVIGTTSGTGQSLSDTGFAEGRFFTELEPPRPGSLDALMAASHDGLFATDLRRLSPADAATVLAVSEQRLSTFYCEISPLDAYDAVIHLPHVTAADPDDDALAHSPEDVREAFALWRRR
ncbi:erythromycin esterase [Streptoalloteichus tenebrarius]|uniref:Erythromycin esterase n=1 Tax=Streptoalloteichus tenebrarius (strain ATCC 17920 / DSM 40477 / JCM 4838 / CBS 697.72 / NBRC 16177 / NCIMB 11028 / NRRL B-12390 / A12253. 1 / ISP 5477) TaxID=1933 RepID=A0ABT1HNS4_STRSD|nr:erythromycin esterase family protein [Streptoalloteichus tenebrarius]MCP2257160.1 erythromycin esterase [Streptoalloteichus tenebrarius]BFE98795.1 erythromycin esterase family protein [Streptoalloteichus tenebrarius]